MGTLNNRCRIIIGTQKGTLILTTTRIRGLITPLVTTHEPPSTGSSEVDVGSPTVAGDLARQGGYTLTYQTYVFCKGLGLRVWGLGFKVHWGTLTYQTYFFW